jgi:hypothetical protein
VGDPEHGDQVDQSVQTLPGLATEPAHHRIGRRDGERNHQQVRAETECQIRALGEIRTDRSPVEKVIDPDERNKVRRGVEKGGQSEHPSQTHQPVPAGHPADRRNRQRHQQHHQRPGAERAQHELDRVGAKTVGQTQNKQTHERHQRQQRERGTQPIDRAWRRRMQQACG